MVLFVVRYFISTGATLLTWLAMTALAFFAYSGLYAPADVEVALAALRSGVIPEPIPQTMLLAALAAAVPVFAYQQFLCLFAMTMLERASQNWEIGPS